MPASAGTRGPVEPMPPRGDCRSPVPSRRHRPTSRWIARPDRPGAPGPCLDSPHGESLERRVRHRSHLRWPPGQPSNQFGHPCRSTRHPAESLLGPSTSPRSFGPGHPKPKARNRMCCYTRTMPRLCRRCPSRPIRIARTRQHPSAWPRRTGSPNRGLPLLRPQEWPKTEYQMTMTCLGLRRAAPIRNVRGGLFTRSD